MDAWHGRKALVTGASDGMGRAVALRFAAQGAEVLAVGRSLEKLATLSAEDTRIHAFAQDLFDAYAVDNILAEVQARLGALDILVNCAGAFEMAGVAQVDEALLHRMMSVNCIAPAMLCVRAIPLLEKSGHGRIINVGSLATHYTDHGLGAYNASKQALVGFTMNLALELGQKGITANILSPGMTRTGMTKSLLEDSGVEAFFASRTPVGRVGMPNDVAHAAAYLASPEAGFINGVVMKLDGGYTAGAYSSDWNH